MDRIAKNLVRVALLTALAASLPFGHGTSQAQEPALRIAELRVSLWPEYDDPRLLVIYRGRFDASTTFPQTATFPIPVSAEVNAAAYTDATGDLLTAPWRARQESGSQLITIDLPVPSFQLEFYDDAIRGTVDRAFSFNFQPPYAVDSLRFDVQQPLTASNLEMEPPATETTSDAAGFQYAIYNFGAVGPDKTIELKGGYVKVGAGTSVSPPSVPSEEGSTPPATPAAAAVLSRRPLLIGAAILLLGIAALAGTLWLRGTPLPTRRREPVSVRGPAASAFCTQCGTRLVRGDRFCRQCGTAVSTVRTARRQRRRLH